MNVTELRGVLERTLSAMPSHADELRKLDAALGDGDLGITVESGSNAAFVALAELDDAADVGLVLRVAAKAFSTANPSTFAALIGGGLLAASKTVAGKTELSREGALEIGEAVAARIAERGNAKLGDKTVLDALIPSLDTLRGLNGNSDDPLAAMIDTAAASVQETSHLQSAKGRASWMQERSVGHPDAGATAYLRFLQELRAHWSS